MSAFHWWIKYRVQEREKWIFKWESQFPLIMSQEFHIQELIDGSCPCHRQNDKQLQNNELQAEIILASDGVDHGKVILSISLLMQNSFWLHIPQCSAWFTCKWLKDTSIWIVIWIVHHSTADRFHIKELSPMAWYFCVKISLASPNHFSAQKSSYHYQLE